jgi:hypothetical protein
MEGENRNYNYGEVPWRITLISTFGPPSSMP